MEKYTVKYLDVIASPCMEYFDSLNEVIEFLSKFEEIGNLLLSVEMEDAE